MEKSVLELILQATIVVKFVLLILLFFSISSWTIIIYKWFFFTKAKKETEKFLKVYKRSMDMKNLLYASKRMFISPIALLFRAVYTEEVIQAEKLKRSINKYKTQEETKLYKYLNFLATTGSTTPFIGLFGTVWGIMDAFTAIGKASSAVLAVVAPAIAEALIATAFGIATAVPAVISYNYYLNIARKMSIEMEDFADDLLYRLVFNKNKDEF